MAKEIKFIKGNVTTPKGFVADGISCGIKAGNKKDLAVVFSQKEANAAGMFTKNKFVAAPVILTKETLRSGKLSAVAINSGNANAVTGKQGLKDACDFQARAASVMGLRRDRVGVCSTGVIGVKFPLKKICAGLGKIKLSASKGALAAGAIMTTDTVKKEGAVCFNIGGKKVSVAGMAKGSGMIEPNMATMLAIITTDAAISTGVLKKALKEAVSKSFNVITVDGNESTNDSVIVIANGMAGNSKIIAATGKGYKLFLEALTLLCTKLAKDIVYDGEGATKMIEISVEKAASYKSALRLGKAVANSNLFKTAVFGKDPNWGRIVAAMGSVKVAACESYDPGNVDIFFGKCLLVQKGNEVASNVKKAKTMLSKKEIDVRIVLNAGNAKATVWSCDLSYDYITINASYRS